MFELRIESIFTIGDRGSVFVGRLAKGRIALGDPAILKTPSREVRCSVNGLEKARQMVTSSGEGEEIGVLCREIRLEHLADCYVGDGDARHPEGVFLVSTPRRWWEFWRE